MIQRERFPISLVFPPQGHFTQPYLALPCLKGWLEAHGFDDVELMDANIEAYDAFLSREYLERCRERVAKRLPLADFERRESLGFRDLGAFRAAAECAASGAAVAAGIDEAKAVVRGGAFYDAERYVPAVRTIYHALRIVSAAHFPSELTPHNFTMRYGNDRSEEVFAATRDEAENPFVEFYRTHVLPRIVARRPRVLGLSIIYGSQLVPALTLARLVKEALPDCHITAGGGFLAYIGKKLMNAPGIDSFLDSLIFHEGEAPRREHAGPSDSPGRRSGAELRRAAVRALPLARDRRPLRREPRLLLRRVHVLHAADGDRARLPHAQREDHRRSRAALA